MLVDIVFHSSNPACAIFISHPIIVASNDKNREALEREYFSLVDFVLPPLRQLLLTSSLSSEVASGGLIRLSFQKNTKNDTKGRVLIHIINNHGNYRVAFETVIASYRSDTNKLYDSIRRSSKATVKFPSEHPIPSHIQAAVGMGCSLA